MLTRKFHIVAMLVAWALLGAAILPAVAQGLPGPSAGFPVAAAPAQPVPMAVAPASTAMVVDDNYRLGSGDKVRIKVYGEDDLGGEFLVDATGEIQFPLIGRVKASGLTVHEFVTQMESALGAKYLRDPKVNLQIENYRPFYIIGEVNKPGEYPYQSGMDVLSAVALAGGYTYRANERAVDIRRRGSSREESFSVAPGIKVNPGDIVRVRERIF